MDVQVDGRNRARRKGGAGGMIGAVSGIARCIRKAQLRGGRAFNFRIYGRARPAKTERLCTAVPHWWRGDEVWLSGRVGLFTSGFARRSLRPARWLHSGSRAHNWTGPRGRPRPMCHLVHPPVGRRVGLGSCVRARRLRRTRPKRGGDGKELAWASVRMPTARDNPVSVCGLPHDADRIACPLDDRGVSA